MNMKKYAVTAAVAAVLSGTFAGTVPAFAAGVSTTIAAKQVEVDRATQKVKEVEVKSSNYPGSVTVSKTEEDVKEAIKARYADARNIVVTKKTDDKDGTPFVVYKATFETDAFTGEALLNPATCYIGYQELTYK